MKIAVTFTKKSPGPEEYSSQGYHLTIETEPPAEVAQDREKLRGYVEELFAECRARVEDQIAGGGRAAPAPERSESRSAPAPSRRAPVRVVRGGPPREGRTSPRTDDGSASPKQLNFLRSLGSQAGMSYGQVAALAEETFGVKDLRSLSKRQASELIDQLRSEAA